MIEQKPPPAPGHVEKGYRPIPGGKEQAGYVAPPRPSETSPPTGGSGVKAPPKSK